MCDLIAMGEKHFEYGAEVGEGERLPIREQSQPVILNFTIVHRCHIHIPKSQGVVCFQLSVRSLY